ncbi:MAG: DUF4157 domain-containing protein [Sulfurifustis sp.]
MKLRVPARRGAQLLRRMPRSLPHVVRRAPVDAEIRRVLQEPASAPGRTESYINSLDGRGQTLAPDVRSHMESRFGADFSDVRVHADGDAAVSARALDAKAYTYGNHLVFGAGQYAPESHSGRRLIAHELAHTVQHTRGAPAPAVQRVVDGDPTKIEVTESWARDLNESELPDQIARLEQQVKTTKKGSAERKRAEKNLKVLQAEKNRRAKPLPKAAEPTKGEKSVATLKMDAGGEEKIFASRIPGGIWWFNGATPTLAALYPSEVEADVSSAGKGKFDCNVTKGADKIGLVSGGGASAKLSGTDLTTIKFRAIGASKSKGDVEVKIDFTPAGGGKKSATTLKMETNAPQTLDLLRAVNTASGKHGYLTTFSLRIFDNFGAPLPYLDVNEDFTVGDVEKGVSSHWKDALKARKKGATITGGNAVFDDHYEGSVSGGAPPKDMTPAPTGPQKPLGTTLVGSFEHRWYVGTKTTGAGVHVSTHKGIFFADHGEYTKLKSPP